MSGKRWRSLVLCRLIIGVFVLMLCMQAAVAMAGYHFDDTTGRLEVTDFESDLEGVLTSFISQDRVMTLAVLKSDAPHSRGFEDADFKYIKKNLKKLQTLDLRGVDLYSSSTFVPDDVFRGNTTLTTVYLPLNVTKIGEGAFRGCKNLATVNFGDLEQLEVIGQAAFRECVKLTGIPFEKMTSLKIIGKRAFISNDLREITMPDSLSTEGLNNSSDSAFYKAFEGNMNLRLVDLSKCVDFNPPVTKVEKYHPVDPVNLSKAIIEELDSTDFDIAQDMFYNCPNIEWFSFPPNIQRIPRGFLGLDKEISAYLPVTSLSARAASAGERITTFVLNGAYQLSGKFLKNRNNEAIYLYSMIDDPVSDDIKKETTSEAKVLRAFSNPHNIFAFNIFGNAKEGAKPPTTVHYVLSDKDWHDLINAMLEFAGTFSDAVFPKQGNIHYYNAKSLDVNLKGLADRTMLVNGTHQYSGIKVLHDGQTTDLPIFWTSSDPSVATVDGKGNVVALKPGSTMIEAAAWPHEKPDQRKSVKATVKVLAQQTGDDGGGTSTDPGSSSAKLPESVADLNIVIKIGDDEYTGVVQPDGSLLITVPYGTDLSEVTLTYDLPDGIAGTPASGTKVDMSNGFSIVLENDRGNTKSFTIKGQIQASAVVEGSFLDLDTSNWQVYLLLDEQGAVQVRVVIPVSSALTDLPETITMDISGLGSIVLTLRDADGTLVYERARRGMKGYTLEVRGTARNRDALDAVLFKSISAWFQNDAREHRQTFGTGVRIADMRLMGEEGGPSDSSGGCHAGAAVLAVLGLATVFYLRRSTR